MTGLIVCWNDAAKLIARLLASCITVLELFHDDSLHSYLFSSNASLTLSRTSCSLPIKPFPSIRNQHSTLQIIVCD